MLRDFYDDTTEDAYVMQYRYREIECAGRSQITRLAAKEYLDLSRRAGAIRPLLRFAGRVPTGGLPPVLIRFLEAQVDEPPVAPFKPRLAMNKKTGGVPRHRPRAAPRLAFDRVVARPFNRRLVRLLSGVAVSAPRRLATLAHILPIAASVLRAEVVASDRAAGLRPDDCRASSAFPWRRENHAKL